MSTHVGLHCVLIRVGDRSTLQVYKVLQNACMYGHEPCMSHFVLFIAYDRVEIRATYVCKYVCKYVCMYDNSSFD